MRVTIIFFLALMVNIHIYGQTSFYTVALNNVAGNPISLSAYAGKKTFITVCSAAVPDTRRLKMLDSLARSNPAIGVIVIPIQDFDVLPVAGSALNQLSAVLKKTIEDSLNANFTLAGISNGKKASTNQQPLMAWLTSKSGNTHFDYDLNSVWQTFVVNEHGILFAVLEGNNDLLANYKTLVAAQVVEK